MAKFQEVFTDTEELFDSHLIKIDNLNNVKIKILAQNRLKEIAKVSKASDILKHMTDEDVIILLNEEIFEQLEPVQKDIVIEELLAQIYFDSEKDVVKIIKPDVPSGFSLVMAKHGMDTYIKAKLLIKELFSKKEQDDSENNVEAE